MVGLERPQGQPRIFTHPANTHPPSMFDPDITIEGEDAVQADMGGDACCIDAKNKWIEGLREIFGEDIHGGQVIAASAHPDSDYSNAGIKNHRTSPYFDTNGEIYRAYEEMSCEEFRDAIEQFAGGRPGPYYKANVGNRRNPTSEHYLAKRILEEWDMCEAKSTFGNDMSIYASEDAFDAGWNAIQKQIGRDDYTYSMYLQPSLLTDTGPLQREIPMQLGMYSVGSLPLNTAVQHLEQLEQDPTEFATQLGYETPESAGLRQEDFDEDEWWEVLAQHGISGSPEEFLEHEGMDTWRVQQILEQFANLAGRMPMADELRANLDHSYYYPQAVQYGGGINRYLQWADERRDEGRDTMPVSSGSISALGQGPMIDVNPLFRGMGLGLNTMGSLLENVGRIEEAVASPAGLGAFRAMDAGLREMGIDPNTKINVNNLMENERQRAEQWGYNRDSRYPVRGIMSMSVPEGTQINPVLPNTAKLLLGTRDMNEQGIEPIALEDMRNLIDRTQEEIPKRQLGQILSPPGLRGQPFRQPRFLDKDNFRVEGLWG